MMRMWALQKFGFVTLSESDARHDSSSNACAGLPAVARGRLTSLT